MHLSRLVVVVCAWACVAVAARPVAGGPLDFDGAPPSRIVLTWAAEPPADVTGVSMVDRLTGIAGVVAPTEHRRLAALSRRAERVGWPAETEVLGYAHVTRGEVTHSYRMGVTPDRLALFGEADGSAVYAIDADGCEAVVSPILVYGGGLDDAVELPLGAIAPMPTPYRHSPILLDAATVRERLNGGRQTNLEETMRVLADEQLFIRLPAGYTARRPAGLLVWVPAGEDGRPPQVFDAAADTMNLVMVGASDSGNVRLVTDRYQLALDQVATAVRLVHIDPERVYVTGISGGGRVSSALAVCFPEIFTGVVPIVGVNCYEHVPLGDGRFVPMGYRRPDAALWRLVREHRIAVMSGPLDFNYREITNAVRIFQRDGLDARFFDYEDMAHTLPTAERFAEALGWVDEPVVSARAKAAEEAGEQLETYLVRFDELPVTSDTQRRLLERVAATAPWSPAAWRACELLGVVEPPGVDEGVSPSRTPGTP